jgi:hypothetical protein
VTRVFLVLSVVLACFAGVFGACAPMAPCSPTDTVMLAKAAECRARVQAECADVLDSDCPVIRECDEWGEKRCGFPSQGGAGGAP